MPASPSRRYRPPQMPGARLCETVLVIGAEVLAELGLTGAAYAAPAGGGADLGFHADDLVTPASVMKIQVALMVETMSAAGSLDGRVHRLMVNERRTPGTTGISLMRDDVSMSRRDLVVAMMTVSDNVAIDELIEVVGLNDINDTTRRIGLDRTEIVSDLRDMLDAMARDVGFSDYRRLTTHDPDSSGPPSDDEIKKGLAVSSALDPALGTRTTAARGCCCCSRSGPIVVAHPGLVPLFEGSWASNSHRTASRQVSTRPSASQPTVAAS